MSKNQFSLEARLRALRQALNFGKGYPITKGIGIKAQSLTLTLPALPTPPPCHACGQVKRRK